MTCWDPRIEEMSKDDLQALQYKHLKTLVYKLYSFSPFYHGRMKAANVHPDDIRSLQDIVKLPFAHRRTSVTIIRTRCSLAVRLNWCAITSSEPLENLPW